MQVLIMDDNEEVRSSLMQFLRNQGHDVREAVNGQEGLARVREHRPDAIICDGLMPVMDGFQLLQTLKKDPGLSSIPFIFHTSVYTGEREQELARTLGADAFLVKPQPPDAIYAALQAATAGRDATAGAAAALTVGDAEFAQEYSRVVATALEEKVAQFERVTRDLERTQKELRESEAAYRGLFENNPQPMWVYDLETLAFLAVNDAAIISYGFSREEFLAMTIKDIRRPEDVQKLISRVSAAADGFDAVGVWKHRKKNGTIIDVELASHALDFSGQRAKLVLANDVTERSRMGTAIQHAAGEWRATFDAMTEEVALLDADGRIMRCNRAMAMFMKKPFSELIGQACADMCACSGESREGCPFLKSKKTLKREAAVFKQGEQWFEASADPIVDETGAFQGAVHILQDITKRRRAEDSIREQQQFTENLIMSSAIATFVVDAAHRVLIWNKACEELTGVSAASVVGTKGHWKAFYDQERPVLADIVLGQTPEKLYLYYESCSQSTLTPDGIHAEEWLKNLNHKDRHIVFDAAPIRDASGRIIAAIETLQDFTDHKKLEEQIHQAKQDWEYTFNSITDMVTVHDQDYNIIQANKAAEKILNLPVLEKMKGRKCFAYYHGTNHAPEGCPSCSCLQTGVSATFEIFEPHLDRLIEIRAIPRFDSNNKLIGLIHVVRDITERKQFEQQLKTHTEQLETAVKDRTRQLEDANTELQLVNRELVLRREEAEAASRSKTDFLANMSHELRTPLNAIMGFSEIMQMGMAGPVSDKQKEFLGDIAQSGKHLLSLINDILDLSKVEAGKMELEPEQVIVGELVGGSLMMFKEKALKHSITMDFTLDPEIPRIVADRRKLKQVLVNLLSNAFKFTPDGGSVRVSARLARGSELIAHSNKWINQELSAKSYELDADFMEISVVDTGVGITREHQQKLFQPFEQIDSSLTRKHAGTGLGLSLCRRFVELHGGMIWVESEPGKGSTFSFVVPIS